MSWMIGAVVAGLLVVLAALACEARRGQEESDRMEADLRQS